MVANPFNINALYPGAKASFFRVVHMLLFIDLHNYYTILQVRMYRYSKGSSLYQKTQIKFCLY